MFASSQTGGNGRNIVLFNHASAAEPDDIPPGMASKVWITNDEEDYSITVFEEVPPPAPPEPPKTRDVVFGISMPIEMEPPPFEDDASWLNYQNPTLRIDLKSVNVMDMTGVQYSYDERYVSRIRHQKKEDEGEPDF